MKAVITKELGYQLRRIAVISLCCLNLTLLSIFSFFAWLGFRDLFEKEGPKVTALTITIYIGLGVMVVCLSVMYVTYLASFTLMVFEILLVMAASVALMYCSLIKTFYWASFIVNMITLAAMFLLVYDLYLIFVDKLKVEPFDLDEDMEDTAIVPQPAWVPKDTRFNSEITADPI